MTSSRSPTAASSTGSTRPSPLSEPGFCLQGADPRRSESALWTDETLGEQLLIYTFSDVAIKVSEASDFGTAIGAMPLDYPNSYWWLFEQ